MKNSCFRTSASSLVKRKFGYNVKNLLKYWKKLFVGIYWENLISDEKWEFWYSLIVPENIKRGDLLGFLKLQFVAKYQKMKGTLWGQKIKSHSAENNWKGDPLVSSGFVCYV